MLKHGIIIACLVFTVSAGVDDASAAETLSWEPGNGFRHASVKVRPGKAIGFSALSPEETGIRFTNALPIRLILENNNFMNGSGVAAGDFDGDGLCDLYFCAIAGTNALYRNLGGWRFEDVTAVAGVGLAQLPSTGAIFSDIDGDDDLDLLAATLGNGVHSFVNDGNGRFRETTKDAGLLTQAGSMSLAMSDVDGDGDLDLYVANYGAIPIMRSGGRADMKLVNGQWIVTGPYADRLRFVDGRLVELGEPDVLYLNDGHGHFRAVPWNSESFLDEDGKPMPAPWDFGLTVQMRDINGDGSPDIYVCNDFQTPDRIWLNDGLGRFRALPRLAMRKQSYSSMGVDFADIDRDGFMDFGVVEMLNREHAGRMRQVVSMQVTAPIPGRIDNRPDVLRNTLYRNRGDGTYAEIANFSDVTASGWSWQPVFLDVDLDGYEDLLIGTGMAFDLLDRDALQRIGSLGKQTPEQSRTNLLLYPPLNSANRAYRNRGNVRFEDASAAWRFDSRRISQGIALADLDNDGDLDVVINCLNSTPLLYRNETLAPRAAVRLKGLKPNPHGIGAMIRVLGGPVPVQMQEILSGGRYLSGDDSLRVFAAGSVTNDLTIEVRWRSGRNSVVRGAKANRLYLVEEPDAPGSQVTPLKTVSPRPEKALFKDVTHLLEHVHHEELFDDYTRQPLLMKQLSQLGPGVAWIDLDGDGKDELVVGTGRSGTVEVFRRDKSNRFEKVTTDTVWHAPDDVTGFTVWFSAEGKPALLAGVANYESGPTNAPPLIRVWIEASSNRLQVATAGEVPPFGPSVGPLAAADIDGDGDLDLFVGGRVIAGDYPRAPSSKVFRRENGKLVADVENNRALENVGLVSGAVWSDLDLDGYAELVLACEWGPVRIFKNERGRLRDATTALGLAKYTGWWNGVATGDFDEDGRLDIVAGNWGLNTGYQASDDQPLRLHYGKLGEKGPGHLIEAYYASDLKAVAPRRTLNALSQAFPMLSERFLTHQAFSVATIRDLLGSLPAQFQEVTATTLATTLFLNRETNFVAVSLPMEAQLAPAFAINVADFDGDGHEDVFLSQNFFGMRPEWERLDAGRGLWLKGDGKGNLTAIPGHESGVTVYGEQRGAAVGDFNDDGRTDLVVTQNGAPTRLYENIGARPGLRVRIKGPPGNPVGIGAILQFESDSRRGPVHEVHAGSGYWSQDSAVQVIGNPDQVRRVRVRWPGGNSTIGTVPSGSRELHVDASRVIRAF
jgi:enediyne biosynthesis protein E4